MILRKLIITCFFVGTVISGFCQRPFLKHLTVDEGLPSNEVYQVTEDRLGNLLIATDRGVARFDGYSVESLPFEKERKVAPVYYLYKTKTGKILFSGTKGHLFEYYNDRLNPYPYNNRLASQYQHTGLLIANNLAYNNDSLYISFNNDYPTSHEIGTAIVSSNGEVKKWFKPEGIYFDLTTDFHHRESGVESSGLTLQKVHITWPDHTTTTDSIDLSWPNRYVRRLYAGRADGYDLFCMGREVFIYRHKKRVGHYSFPNGILSFTLLPNSVICFGFEYGGAALYRFTGGVLGEPFVRYLTTLSVNDVYEDRQHGLWFATMEDGLYYAYPSRPQYTERQGKIQAIDAWRNQVHVAYYSGEIDVYSQGNLATTKKVPLQSDEFLLRFSFQSDGQIVVITNRGYHREKNGSWQFVEALNLSLIPVHENLLYGTDLSYPQLHLYKGFEAKPYKTIKLPSRPVSAFQDVSGCLWLGTWEGLYQYRNDSLVTLTSLHPAFTDRIIAIRSLPSGWVAIATLGKGLVLMKNDRMIHLTVENGLISPIINSMRIDVSTIYLGTNKGVTAVFVNEKGAAEITHYGTEAGLPTLDVHQFAVSDKRLYGKWVNRLFLFSLPGSPSSFSPSVYLRNVQVNGETIAETAERTFSHLQRSFTFHYNSVNLAGAQQQTYVYQLEGFENRKHYTKERIANYTNLPPGEYTFKVSVKDDGGKLTGTQTYQFVIAPAFWQEAWFLWLMGLCLLLLIYFIFRFQLRVAKEQDQLRLNLAESNQRALIQLINPHFISNLLNTVHAAILKENKIEAASVISRFAKLMRLTMELGKEKFILLEREAELLKEYMTLEKMRAPDKFDYAIIFGPGVDPKYIQIPGMLIQPFVENAIKHGVMHLPHKGQVTVEISKKDGRLLCQISDNGIGTEKARRINANKLGNHQSAGMGITVNRLMLLHKENKGEFIYEITKLNPANSQYPGTTVRFSLPFKPVN